MTRITKDQEERKKQIMDIAEELFLKHGFDATAVSDIVKTVGVTQGTFYYYFKSKEDILNALIERYLDYMIQMIEKEVGNVDLNAQQKLQAAIDVLFRFEREKENMVEYFHREKNASLHQRLAMRLIREVIPFIIQIIRQGVGEGLFDVKYPEESAEILLIGIAYIHDMNRFFGDEKNYLQKLKAAEDVLERVLGARKGSFKLV